MFSLQNFLTNMTWHNEKNMWCLEDYNKRRYWNKYFDNREAKLALNSIPEIQSDLCRKPREYSCMYAGGKLQIEIHTKNHRIIIEVGLSCSVLIPCVPEKAERWIFSTLWAKRIIFVYVIIDQTSSAEENDTKINEFGWVILILCPFLKIRSFSNFARCLRPMSEELCRE